MRYAQTFILITVLLLHPSLAQCNKAVFRVHPSTRTVSAVAAAMSDMLVGTTGGLLIVNDEGKRLLLAGIPIRQIISDGATGAYIATDYGLYHWDESVLSKLWDKPVTSVIVKNRCLLLGSLAGRIVKWYRGITKDFAKLPSQSPVHSLVEDDGKLRAATVQGMWIYNNGVFEEEKLSDELLHQTITVLKTLGGRLFAGTPDGLFENLQKQWIRLGRGKTRACHVNDIAKDEKGIIYIATAGDGVLKLRNRRLRTIRKSTKFVTALTVFEDKLYLGTLVQGLLLHGKSASQLFSFEEEPPGNAITSLAYANETNTLVVGTFDNGVGLAKGSEWTHYRAENGNLSSNWVSHVASGGKGVLLRHSDGSVYCQYSGDYFRKLGVKDGWPKEWTSSIGTCGWRSWAGTYSAFFLRSANSWKTVAPKPTLHGNIVLDVELLDKEAWVATHRNGLYRWDALANEWRQYTLGSGMTDTWVTCVEEFQGEIWAGTFAGGLCRLRGTEEERSLHPNDYLKKSNWQHYLKNRGVNCLVVTEDELWIGTQKGLIRWDGSEFSEFGLEDGLPSSTIWAITSDGQNLWIGTDVGLCSASLETLRRF